LPAWLVVVVGCNESGVSGGGGAMIVVVGVSLDGFWAPLAVAISTSSVS
jgi:hypothetical protein